MVIIVVVGLAMTLALSACQQEKEKKQPDKPAPEFEIPHVNYPGTKHMKVRWGPLLVRPGSNDVDTSIMRGVAPKVPGYITRFSPRLEYANGEIPEGNTIHFHHGGWLINDRGIWAAGEERSILQVPRGFGISSKPNDHWVSFHMLHNLTTKTARVWLVWDMDFVPLKAAGAKQIRPYQQAVFNVGNPPYYPVFDALHQYDRNGTYTFPDQAPASEQASINMNGAFRRLIVKPETLIYSWGHLHPGGIKLDMRITRKGKTRLLFSSQAHYWHKSGPVSWDMSMTASRTDWRVALQPGDLLTLHATYDTSKYSWYEAMGIMVVGYVMGRLPGAADPFVDKYDTTGILTHGHLKENRNFGNLPTGRPDARMLPDGEKVSAVGIAGFRYSPGDQLVSGEGGLPPVTYERRPITFTNWDSDRDILHTVTACQPPCNRSTGITYPLADGPIYFDSGQIGFGPVGLSPAIDRRDWQTPRNLPPGTYTYFCRIHPFMRGSFRVKPIPDE